MGADKKREIRCWNVEAIGLKVIRSNEGNDSPKITGYAAVFNKDSEDLGGFIERIKPGAFKNSLKSSDTRALFNHDSNYPLGRVSAGTLRLKEDKNGLLMEIDPPETQYARDLMVSIERGDVREQSFGFTVISDTWENLDKDIAMRTINEIGELFDVSPVVFPAYPDTDVAIRSLDKQKKDAAIRANHTEAILLRNKNLHVLAEAAERI